MDNDSDLKGKLEAARKQYEANRKKLVDPDVHADLRRIAGDRGGPLHITRAVGKISAAPEEARAFRRQYVEPLLQQASSLVDRVLAEDNSYRQMLVDQTNLRLDLEELERLQTINDDEVTAGLFQVPFWEGNATLQSDKALAQAQTTLTNFVNSNADQQAKFSAWAAENSQQPLATGWESKLSKHSLRLYGGFTAPAGDVPSGATGTDGNILGGIISHNLANYSFNYTQQQLASQQAPVNARLDWLQKRVTYLEEDAGFRERRKISAHQKLMDKLAAVQAPHGPLNYADRQEAIEHRAAVDLYHAHARLKAVHAGLIDVYGVHPPRLPSLPSTPLKNDDFNFLNEIVDWIRQVSFILQRIYDNDQDLVVSFSVAEMLPHGGFAGGRKEGQWNFTLGPERFQGFKLLRLRGISAVANASDRSYSFVIHAPRPGTVFHGHGETGKELSFDIDPCWLGHVAPGTFPWKPEVAGARVLWNASPVGCWKLSVAPGTTACDLHDLRLNLHVTAQALA